MNEFIARLKQRKLVQWLIAYVASAWAVLQVLDLIAQEFGWPGAVMRVITVVFGIGFFVALVLAWYHGERGAQRVGGIELAMLAALLVIAAVAVGWVRHDHRPAVPAVAVVSPAASTATAEIGADTARGRASASAASSMAAAPIPAQAIPAKSVAVLPFENLSTDKGNAYFADGMQDLILTKLADIGDLKVISRTSTEKYKSHPDDLKTIGQQLGVATILEGSVQKAGNRVLINVQLIDARSDTHIWAQSYTRTLDNIFGVEGEVAEKVANALKAKLSSAEAASLAAVPTRDQVALDLYLRAEYQANLGLANLDFDHWRAAISLYRQATTHDPGFALAYARMSYTESFMVWFGDGEGDVKSWADDARRDAEQALTLAPDLAAAWIAVGYADHFGSHDDAAAAKAFEKARSIKPNDADALAGLGLVEVQQGHVDASVELFQRAFALDPRSATRATEAGAACMWVFRYADAERLFQRALALDPREGLARVFLAWTILYGSGNIPRALSVAPYKSQQVSLLVYQRKYRAALTLSDSVPPEGFSTASGESKALMQAELYRLLGDTAKARPLFEQALALVRAQCDKHPDASPKLMAALEYHIAVAEFGLGQTRNGLDAIVKMQAAASKSIDRATELRFMREAARLYAQIDRADLAVPVIAKALATSGMGLWYSPAMLRIDPAWDPIRSDPRFQALLKKYEQPASTTAASHAPTGAGAIGSDHG
jgi:TolB-like protein